MTATRAECHPNGISQFVDTGFHCTAGGFVEFDLFAHMSVLRSSVIRPGNRPQQAGISGAVHD
jgi:hypothetical protein